MVFTFTRPGFATVTITDEQLEAAATGELRELFVQKLERLNRESALLNVAHRLADQIWQREAVEMALALEITAEEYARQARKGLVAELLQKNAARYAARATSNADKAGAAALYRQAARATRAAAE